MDRRDLAASNRWWDALDTTRMRAAIDDEDGNEVWIPIRLELCGSCEGRGRYVNPSIDRNGLSSEDFEEQGEDFREDYFSGGYDVTCGECQGLRVVPVYNGDDRPTAKKIEKTVAENHAYEIDRQWEMAHEW